MKSAIDKRILLDAAIDDLFRLLRIVVLIIYYFFT